MSSYTTGKSMDSTKYNRKEWKDLPDIPVDHLDYAYIDDCNDPEYLKKILAVLESGKEGRYPDLERHCDAKLMVVLPVREAKLRAVLKRDATPMEVSDAKTELGDWLSSIKGVDKSVSDRHRKKLDSDSGAGASLSLPTGLASRLGRGTSPMKVKGVWEEVDKEGKTTLGEVDVNANANANADEAKSAHEKTKKMNQLYGRSLPPVRGEKSRKAAKDGKEDFDSDDEDEEAASARTGTGSVGYGVTSSKATKPGQKPGPKGSKISGYDWDSWERYDVDAECAKIDEREEEKKVLIQEHNEAQEKRSKQEMKRKQEEVAKLGMNCEELEQMSRETRQFMAVREKQKGNECFRAGEHEVSQVHYSRSIAFDPSNHIVWANRAMAFLRLKKYKKAEDDCSKAMELDKTYTKAITRRGMSRHKQGKYVGAIADFKKALALEPTNSQLKQLLSKSTKAYEEVGGIALDGSAVNPPALRERVSTATKSMKRISIVEESDSDEEEEEEEEPVAKQPTKKRIMITEDDSDSDSDSSSDGEEVHTQIQAEEKEKEKSTGGRRKIVIEMGDSDSSDSEDDGDFVMVQSPTKAASAERSDEAAAAVKQAAGEAYKAGDFTRASSLYTRAIALLPDQRTKENMALLNNRALCAMQEKNHAGVVEDCSEAIELDEDRKPALNAIRIKALLRRGAAYEALNDFQAALNDMCEVMALDPSVGTASTAMCRLMPLASGATQKEFKRRPREKKKEKENTVVESPSTSSEDNRYAMPEEVSQDKEKEEQEAKEREKKIAAKKKADAKAAAKKAEAEAAAAAAAEAEAAKKAEATKLAEAEAAKALRARTAATAKKQEGNKLFSAGKLGEAIRCYGEAVSLEPNGEAALAALSNRSLAYLKQGGPKSTLADCKAALALIKEFEDAEAEGAQSKKHLKTKVKLHFRAGLAHKALEQFDEAEEQFRRALIWDSNNAQAQKELKEVETLRERKGVRERVEQIHAEQQQVKASAKAKAQAKGKKEKPMAAKTSTTRDPSHPPENPATKAKREGALKAASVAEKAARLTKSKSTPKKAPKTATEFERNWRELRGLSVEERGNAMFTYMQMITPKAYKKLCKSGSMDDELMMDMIYTIRDYYIPAGQSGNACAILRSLTKIERFDMIFMFFSDKQKQTARDTVKQIAGAADAGDTKVSKSFLAAISKSFGVK